MAKPKIRFNGYTEDWEQRKFGEIVEKYEDPVETPTEGYTRLGIRSHAKGTFHSYVEKGKELETAKMFRVAADKFIVNITFGWEHAVAITDENDAGKLVSHRFPQYSFNAGMEPKFFRYLILDENFKHHLELSSPGGAGRNRVLKLSDMLQYKMNFPSEAEQKKIAAYFDDLDHLITLHQRKCEQTKTLKKYMLQKMFPQDGEKVPQIRFEGFTEDWEQRKVSGIGNIVTGSTPKTSVSDNYGGEFLFVSPADIQENRYVDETITTLTKKGFDQGRKIREKASLFVSIGSTIGKVAQINQESTTNQQINAVEPYDNFDDDFIFTSLENISGSIKAIASNQAVPIVNKTTFGETEIQVPLELGEQQKIGQYFVNLDHLITLHQRKCDELKEVKKFMLQNMFV